MIQKYSLIALVLWSIPLFSCAQNLLPETASIHQSRACGISKKPGLASCNAHILTNAKNDPLVNTAPVGYGPLQFRNAYNVSGKVNNTTIIAIVDAYDDPTIKQDLDTYSKQFNLPILPVCKTTVQKSTIPCFAKINQRGTASLPAVNSAWSIEIALDVEAAHAMCENCSLVLIEASSPNIKNLFQAVDTAVAQGAMVVSNSWGGPELPEEVQLDKHFQHPGIAFTVSSGDSGYGVQYPASSPYVTAVGGTSLYMNTDKSYKDENAWSGAGSGCSQFEKKPSWQQDKQCTGRTVADVSADADPATGAAIYTSTSPKGKKGWFTAGGTSLAAPLIAGIYALGGIPKDKEANSLPYLLGTKSNLHDVIGGSNGNCTIAYLCSGKTKYDGPTGLGTPKGTTAF
jgi:subtilase family serine protease